MNVDSVLDTYRFLAHEGHGVSELRVISPADGIRGIGYFDNEESFADACRKANGDGNVYVGIQPRPKRFLDRAKNELLPRVRGARDDDIEHFTALVIDIDPVRPKNEASTREELACAVSRGDAVAEWLAEKGFTPPVRVMSGNGCQLWFSVPPYTIPKDGREEFKERLRVFEAKIREKFGGDGVAVDSIFNLSRIIKVVGTHSLKGQDTPERPRRVSEALDPLTRVDGEQLLRGILTMPVQPISTRPNAPKPKLRPPGALSETLKALLGSRTKLGRLFAGKGKVLSAADGSQDTSSSGYDYSLLMALISRGIRDPDELASALWHRPDGRARSKGMRYIERTVRHALDSSTPELSEPDPDPSPRKPLIQCNDRQLEDILGDAWEAVLKFNDPPTLFRRGDGEMVRVATGGDRPTIESLDEPKVYHQLTKVARWINIKDGKKTNRFLPDKVARGCLVDVDRRLPKLEIVSTVPAFDDGGKLLATPGYHESASLWVEPVLQNVPAIPREPSADDAEQSRTLLCDELLGEFPFSDDSDRAHAMAALILPFVRPLVRASTPLHLVEAPSPGTGKTLLAQAIGTIATGMHPPMMTWSRDPSEQKKQITTFLLGAPTVMIIDNVTRLKSPTLASLMTSTTWTDRILGSNRNVQLPNNAIWFATANNPDLSMELARRCVRIRLDPKRDRPWLRQDFTHNPLHEWVLKNHGRLVHAVLMLIQNWVAAGKPSGKEVLGSYESWSRVVGGILDVSGVPGFLGGLEELYEEADTEGQEWREFVAAWWERFKEGVCTATELRDFADEHGLLGSVLGDKSPKSQSVRLGKALSQQRGRQFDDLQVVSIRDKKVKRLTYALRPGGVAPQGELL